MDTRTITPPLPGIWLIILIAGLPQLSETVYSPSLPDMARALQTSATLAEHTLTIYLFGFALGILFWGKCSDAWGRKPCMMAGLMIFILGCIGCYTSQTIGMLMMARFIQAFGGSIGSVLAQAMTRDAFHGPDLGKVYASIGSALSIFPALGPLCGGWIAEQWGWRSIFIVLMTVAAILVVLIHTRLPETHPKADRTKVSLWHVAKQLITDTKVLGYGLIIACCWGILFSYFSEGSFYLIRGLGLSPADYGLSFIPIGVAAMVGGMVSKTLQNRYSSKKIMICGMFIVDLALTGFAALAIIAHLKGILPHHILPIISLTIAVFGMSLVTTHALALALSDYKKSIGTASSLFGFFYYTMIALLTCIMGFLHNGTLLPMPLYFFALSTLMLMIGFTLFRQNLFRQKDQ
jgi:MFS transporter, DHA1 family, multidrug resistance protein